MSCVGRGKVGCNLWHTRWEDFVLKYFDVSEIANDSLMFRWSYLMTSVVVVDIAHNVDRRQEHKMDQSEAQPIPIKAKNK
ncbi:hypothetical protein J6590_054669 [Homalodisca vitripennis]|nr:hypothetical protein J6590_054669 [Homalodisca vitripennis]